jgi:proteasome activator subunit 4
MLQDRLDSGWLVWGKTMEVSRLAGWEEQAWKIDEGCLPATDMLKELMGQDGWWQKVS